MCVFFLFLQLITSIAIRTSHILVQRSSQPVFSWKLSAKSHESSSVHTMRVSCIEGGGEGGREGGEGGKHTGHYKGGGRERWGGGGGRGAY